MKYASILIALCMASSAVGQHVIKPSKGIYERKWLKQEKYDLVWFVQRDTQKVKMATVSTQVDLVGSEIRVITRVNLEGRNTPWVDSTVADVKTFRPIYHSSYNAGRDMALKFGSSVTGFYFDKKKNARTDIKDTPSSTEYFDSNIYPHLVRILPLKEGFTATIPIYDYNPAKIGVVNAFVEKVEEGTFETPTKQIVKVWIVTVTDEIGSGEKTTSRYFFGREDRKLWKQEIEAGGRRMSIEAVQ